MSFRRVARRLAISAAAAIGRTSPVGSCTLAIQRKEVAHHDMVGWQGLLAEETHHPIQVISQLEVDERECASSGVRKLDLAALPRATRVESAEAPHQRQSLVRIA